jgi:predicted dehydrogenase
MKRLLDAGTIGEPFLVRVADLVLTRTDWPYGWFWDKARGGGMLQAIGSHYIDLMRWWLSPIVCVTADLRAVVPKRKREDDSGYERVTADDTATVAFRLESGISGRFDISTSAPGGYRRMEVFGGEGVLMIENGAKLYRSHHDRSEEVQPDPRDMGRLEDPRVGPFVELAQRVVDRINGVETLPFTTFEDGLAVQRVMDAIHRSNDERREVWVSDI